MRLTLVASALLLVTLPAQADLGLSLPDPAGPIALDGSAELDVYVEADCSDLLPRLDPDTRSAHATVTVDAPDLTFTGPTEVEFPATACTEPASALNPVSILATYTVTGSWALAGLVPINVNVTAAFVPHTSGLLMPQDPARAVTNITPKAIVDFEVVALDQLPFQAEDGVATVPIQVRTRSNVDLAFTWTAHGRGPRLLESGEPLPVGNLTLPEDGWIAGRVAREEAQATLANSLYRPPTDGKGTDRFVVTARPRIVLTDEAQQAWEIDVDLTYAQRDGKTIVGVDQEARPTPMSPLLPLAALALAMLAGRR